VPTPAGAKVFCFPGRGAFFSKKKRFLAPELDYFVGFASSNDVDGAGALVVGCASLHPPYDALLETLEAHEHTDRPSI
jgi:hypothetical protein